MELRRWFESRVIMIATFILILLATIYIILQMIPYVEIVLIFIGNILIPFGIALVLTYLLRPIVTLLHRQGTPRSIAILITYFLLSLVIVALVVRVLPNISLQLSQLSAQLPRCKQHIREMLLFGDGESLVAEALQGRLQRLFYDVEEQFVYGFHALGSGITETLNLFFWICTAPFLAFYMLKDADYIKNCIVATFPRMEQNNISTVLQEIDHAIGKYICGQLAVGALVGGLAFIGYLIIDLKYALLLAIVVALLNVIPYFGPIIAALPAVLVAAEVSKSQVLFVLLVNFIIQLIEGNIILPYIMGKSLNIHPLLIILVVIVGGEAAGIWGLILAVPVLAILKVITEYWLLRRSNDMRLEGIQKSS